MSNWHPKPLRPEASDPIFKLDQSDSYVVKSRSPIERQRDTDGSPHTVAGGPSRLFPPHDPVYLGPSKLNKSEPEEEDVEKSLDPDAIVKAFFEA